MVKKFSVNFTWWRWCDICDQHQSIKAVNPQGHVVNTVGSGDSTVAGMVAGLSMGLNVDEAFQQAVASGTATAFQKI